MQPQCAVCQTVTYLQSVDAFQTERLFDAVGQVRVVEYDNEAEGLGSKRHRATDPTCKGTFE